MSQKISTMDKNRAVRQGLFYGMGILCRKGSGYAKRIISRSEQEALRGDIKAVGRDFWIVTKKATPKQKREHGEHHEQTQETWPH